MSLILELVRHADALPKEPGGTDLARPLSLIGRRQARMVAERRRERGFFPERVWVSPAQRTRETLAAFGYDFTSIAVEAPDIYESEMDVLLDLIAHIQTQVGRALIVGHNPGLSDLLSYLAGLKAQHMITAAYARLELPSRPARPLRGSGRLLEQWAP